MIKEKLQKYNTNIFTHVMLSALLPCLCVAVVFSAIFLPLQIRSARKNDAALEEELRLDVNSAVLPYYNFCEEITNIIQKKDWLHNIYMSKAVRKAEPSSEDKRQMKSDLMRLSSRQAYCNQIVIRFYDAENSLLTSEGFYNVTAEQQKNSTDSIQRFFASTDYTKGFFSVEIEGERYIVYNTTIKDLPESRDKGEINFLLSEDYLVDKLMAFNIESFELTTDAGNVCWSFNHQQDNVSYSEVTGDIGSLTQSYKFGIRSSIVNSNLEAFTSSLLSIYVLIFVIGFIVSIVFSIKNYKPVRAVVRAVSSDNPEADKKINFRNLEELVNDMLAEKKSNEEQLSFIKPYAQQTILSKVLNGEAFLYGMQNNFEKYGLSFALKNFRVVAFMSAQEKAINEIDSYLNEISNFTQTTYKGQDTDKLKVYLTTDTQGHRLFLLNFDDENYVLDFQKSFEDMGEVAIYCGMGSIVDRVENVYISAEQALTALNYAKLKKARQSVSWSDISDQLSDTYSYTMADDTLLASAVMIGNYDECMGIVSEIVAKNLDVIKTNSKLLKGLYYDIRSTIIRSATRKGILNSDFENEVPSKSEELIGCLSKLLERYCYSVNGENGGKRRDKDILIYIDENIYDSGLSLGTLAENFNVSEAYISKMFKSKTGSNYNDYVNRKRIEKAVELMTMEHCSASSVYERVGYISESTFRRNFAKYTKNKPGSI